MSINAIKKMMSAAVVLCIAVAVQGAVLINENFDGSLPTDGWTYNNYATNTGAESSISGNPGGASLDHRMEENLGVPGTYKSISVSGDDSNEPLKIEFDFNSVRDGTAQPQTFFLRGNGTVGIQLNMETGFGTVDYRKADQSFVTLGTIANGEWYHYSIEVVAETNGVGDTWSLTVTDSSGTPVISANNLEFRYDLSNYDELRWVVNQAAAGWGPQFLLDNVYVWNDVVPPPPAQAPVTMWIISNWQSDDRHTGGLLESVAESLFRRYGRVARGFQVNDLFALCQNRLDELQHPVNVHFNSTGNRALGEQVAEAIQSALNMGDNSFF